MVEVNTHTQDVLMPPSSDHPIAQADLSVGGTQKGDIVKDLMQKAFDLGINMFDVSGEKHRTNRT